MPAVGRRLAVGVKKMGEMENPGLSGPLWEGQMRRRWGSGNEIRRFLRIWKKAGMGSRGRRGKVSAEGGGGGEV